MKFSTFMLELHILDGLHMVSQLQGIVILNLLVLEMIFWWFIMVLSLIMRFGSLTSLLLCIKESFKRNELVLILFLLFRC